MEIIARLANLPGALPGACAQGLIWGIMAIGVYLTYRILDVADLTVDGSFGTGGAVCVMCLLSGMNVWLALLVAVLAGLATGLVTGLLHTFMGIPAILAGILTQLALYSINLKIMGKAPSWAVPSVPPVPTPPCPVHRASTPTSTSCWVWPCPTHWWPCPVLC